MAEITWTITNLDRQTSDGFVTTAHWTCSGVDGEYSASVYATASWPAGTPTTPYDELTQDQVLAWVWESVDKNATEAAVAAQIEALKNPPVSNGVPWSN